MATSSLLPSCVSVFWMATVLLSAAVLPAAGAGEDASGGWKFSFTPYAWLTGLEGTLGIRGVTAVVDASFIDILGDTDSVLGLQGHFEARYGPWGGFLDGTWAKLSADAIPAGRTTLRVENELALVEWAALYQLGDWPLERAFGEAMAKAEPRLGLDLYAGARLTYLQAEIGFNTEPPPDRGARDRASSQSFEGLDVHVSRWQVWVDPILGGRLTLDLYKRFQLLIGGDIGGFGVGSHFTSAAQGLVGYRFQMFGLESVAHAGYRALYQNYTTRTDGSLFRWDVTLHGPILGLTIRF